MPRNFLIALSRDGDHTGLARLHLLYVRHDFVIGAAPRSERQHEHAWLNERDRPVLQLAPRISLGVNVGDLLELKRPLEGRRIADAAPNEQQVVDVYAGRRDAL